MKWSNVKLIFLREFRDQLRDRRTLFTIAVLPLLLYPLLGMVFFKVAQFRKDYASRVWIVGASGLPDDPLLIDGSRFAAELGTESQRNLIELTVNAAAPGTGQELRAVAERAIADKSFDAVIYFPEDFSERLGQFHAGALQPRESLEASEPTDAPDARAPAELPAGSGQARERIPQPRVFFNTANDNSRIAYNRVTEVLAQWRQRIVEKNLKQSNIPVAAAQPFALQDTDVAHEDSRRTAVWSKVFPFVVLIWALTGAFYPAVDLCAGEKERGTLETLLSSPAQRGEIVWGKLLTIMVFSIATSVLNIASMGFTATFTIGQLQRMGGVAAELPIGPPPIAPLAWLLVALIPISALFSALSLAVAAFARSSKEGQYYLLPLLMISLPLMMLPMLPTVELDWGTSLIPVTGMMLLLRQLVEGHYSQAVWYVPAVLGVTGFCCLLSIRWAIDQFNNESVLFRESERWGLGLWLRHLLRDRGDTPTFGEAILCGILLLVISFFASLGLATKTPETWNGFVVLMLVTLIALIATPAVLMTVMLTRSPRATLLLRMPRHPLAPLAAAMLAVVFHPAAMAIAHGVQQLYPVGKDVSEQFRQLHEVIQQAPNFWSILLLMAALPAVCEELAFRGFILSGLRHMGHKWVAIIISSLFFGAVHGFLQQSIAACAVGVLIGYLAVQTGSLLPCILFHLVSNSLTFWMSLVLPGWIERYTWLETFFVRHDQQLGYHWGVTAVGIMISAGLVLWFRSLPYQAYAEEKLQEALDRQTARPAAPETAV